MALGAARADVLSLELGQDARADRRRHHGWTRGAAALTRYLAAMLFGVTPLDPTTLVGVALTFGAVAICASSDP
jgi:hypothetical protein